MGNVLSGSSSRITGAGELVADGSLQYDSRYVFCLTCLGSSRLLRVVRVRHPLGFLVAKIFIKPDTSMSLSALAQRVRSVFPANSRT